MDFEDSVVHDVDWLAAQPKGTVGVVLQQKTGNGPDKWELAIGKGRNGGNAVRVFSPDAAWGEPDVFIVKFRSTGGSVEQFRDEEGFLNEQGRRANRLSFWIKFDDEDWINEVAALQPPRYPYHENLHIGTYQFDRDLINGSRAVWESDNWHFYHQIWIRPDKVAGGWINVVANELPNHQRGIKGNPSLNPTVHSGRYWELLTRFYIQPILQRMAGNGVKYPYGFYIDDIELLHVEEPNFVSISFIAGPQGTKLSTYRGSEQTYEFQLSNKGDSEICGSTYPTGTPLLNPKILDAASDIAVSAICLKPFENKRFRLRILTSESARSGQVYDSGVVFTPDSLLQATETSGPASLSDPNVEQRWVKELGGTDVPNFGNHLRFLIN